MRGFFSSLFSIMAGPLLLAFMLIDLIFLCGCSIGGPRHRLGCYPTSTPGTRFVSADKLGRHSYGFSPFETNGIAYTCNGGHIDITHLRIGADNTRFIAETLYKGLINNQADFSFSLTGDRSKHIVRISYPDNWGQGQKEPIAREVSLQLGQHLAFSATTWHEMLTWFGYHTMVAVPEFSSAFSWEDIYSNLLGTHIAVKALQDTEHEYNEAMTLALHEELDALGAQSASVARKAAHKVRGEWFQGNLAVSMKKRNLDTGLDDGYVTPMIVPDVCQGARPQPYPAPDPDISRYGFSMEYKILPREFEKGKILRIVYADGKGKTIRPEVHFAPIMAQIRRDAIKRFGPEVDIAYDPDSIKQEPVQIAASPSVKEYKPIKMATLESDKKHKSVQTAAKSIAKRKPDQIAKAPSINKSKPIKMSTKSSAKRKPARTLAWSSGKKRDPFEALLKSSAKKSDLFQELWEIGVKEHGSMSPLQK